MNTIYKFTISIFILLTVIFIIPSSLDLFSLNKEKILNKEYWRLLTYSFVHFNQMHLIGNLLGLVLIGLIALELNVNARNYIAIYLSSAVFAVLPLWIIVTFIAAGASSAVYGLFGFVSLHLKKFKLKTEYILLILVGLIFSNTIYYSVRNINETGITLLQNLAHFSGLIFGTALYRGIYYVKKYKNKKSTKILRGMRDEKTKTG